MMNVQPNLQPQHNADFQQKISKTFEQSLTEEQRFLQGILSGKIKTYSHEEVMTELRRVLKR